MSILDMFIDLLLDVNPIQGFSGDFNNILRLMWENLFVRTHNVILPSFSKNLFFIFSFKATCHLRKLENDDFKIYIPPPSRVSKEARKSKLL